MEQLTFWGSVSMLVFRALGLYEQELLLVSKVTSEHYSAIQTRSSVLEGYIQDDHNEPEKPPSAYWKACVQKILLF